MTNLAEAPPAAGTNEPEHDPNAEPEPVDLTQLPLFEGHRVTETRLSFSGNVLVSREVADALELGQDVELVIKGSIASATHRPTKDGQAIAVNSRAVFVREVELG